MMKLEAGSYGKDAVGKKAGALAPALKGGEAYRFIFRRSTPAAPIKPVPNKTSVPGSGVQPSEPLLKSAVKAKSGCRPCPSHEVVNSSLKFPWLL